jgi:hypothetical protein
MVYEVWRCKDCAMVLTADTLMHTISSGQPVMAAVSHNSRPFAKFEIACLNEHGENMKSAVNPI